MITKIRGINAFLMGKKSYVLGTVGVLVSTLWFSGVIDSEVAVPILNILGFGSVVTLRQAISNKE